MEIIIKMIIKILGNLSLLLSSFYAFQVIHKLKSNNGQRTIISTKSKAATK